jgi:ankyrin repeat protein
MMPIHLASYVRSDKFVGIMLGLSADLLAVDNTGRTALLCAAAEGNEIASTLILGKSGNDKGKLLTMADNAGTLPIHAAAAGGHFLCTQLFLHTAYFVPPGQRTDTFERLFDVDVCNRRGETALLLACGHPSVKHIELLLDTKGGGAKGAGGNNPSLVTPLMRAAEKGHVKVAMCLLGRGANKEARDVKGLTPLHYACAGGHVLMVFLLLEQGATLKVYDNERWSPLFYAVVRNTHFDIVKLLLAKWRNLEDQDIFGNTVLIKASEKGLLPMVGCLLDHGAKVNAANHKLHTPFMKACEKGHLEIIQLLMTKGADVTCTTRNGLSTLHKAVESSLDVLKLLIGKVDLETPDNDGNTVLARACWRGNTDAFRLLVEAGAKIDTANNSGKTLLHWAVDEGRTDIFQYLMGVPGSGLGLGLGSGAGKGLLEVDRRDQKGRTALHMGAGLPDKDVHMVLSLLGAGADIEATDGKGETPLHVAAKGGGLLVVHSLVDRKANIEAKSVDLRTPLLHAIESGRPEVISLVLEAGADLFAVDSEGSSAMHLSSKTGNARLVEVLLVRAIKTLTPAANLRMVNDVDAHKHSPLYLAASYGHEEVCKLLLGNGADVLTVAHQGRTPLHVAALKGYVEVINLLVAGKANVDAVDSDHCTPLHLAIERGHAGAALALLVHFSDPLCKTGKGVSPLHLAALHGHTEIALLLIQKGVRNDFHSRDAMGNTILHYAVESGRLEMVRALLEGEVKEPKKLNASTKPAELPAHGPAQPLSRQAQTQAKLQAMAQAQAQAQMQVQSQMRGLGKDPVAHPTATAATGTGTSTGTGTGTDAPAPGSAPGSGVKAPLEEDEVLDLTVTGNNNRCTTRCAPCCAPCCATIPLYRCTGVRRHSSCA